MESDRSGYERAAHAWKQDSDEAGLSASRPLVRKLGALSADFGATSGKPVAAARLTSREQVVLSFLVTLTKSRNELSHRVADHVVEIGLSTDEFLVIWTAMEEPRLTAAAIRRRLGLRQSTFTSMVDRLVERGYITTRRSPRDRRTRHLIPTRVGYTAAKIIRSIHLDLESRAMPHGFLDLYKGLTRLERLVSLLPEPELMEDGLPLVTA